MKIGNFNHPWPLLLWLFLWNQPRLVETAGQAELYQLMDDLFTTYKPEVRPTTAGEATYVYIALFLMTIQNLDEKSQELETSLFLEVEWIDDYLSWNPSNYGNVTYFHYPQKKLWLPDIIVSNSVKSQEQLGYDQNMVSIDNEGIVRWYPSQVLNTACDIDVTYYPFDTQKCSIIISTWVSTKDDIDVDPDASVPIVLSYYSESGTWELVSTSFEDLPLRDNITRLSFTLEMKRLRTFYILNIILPVLFLSFTASMVFFLPADAGEKMGMSITVLLAYAVYLTIIADNMPQTSLQVSILAVYLTILLAITALGVVVSVIVLHLHHKPESERIGKRTKRWTRKVRLVLKLSKARKMSPDLSSKQITITSLANGITADPDKQNPQKDAKITNSLFRKSIVKPYDEDPEKRSVRHPSASVASVHVEEEEITWQKVGETLDRVAFFATSVFIAVFTIIIFAALTFGSLFS